MPFNCRVSFQASLIAIYRHQLAVKWEAVDDAAYRIARVTYGDAARAGHAIGRFISPPLASYQPPGSREPITMCYAVLPPGDFSPDAAAITTVSLILSRRSLFPASRSGFTALPMALSRSFHVQTCAFSCRELALRSHYHHFSPPPKR